MLVEYFANIICTIILSVKKKTFLHPNVDVEMEVRGLRLNACFRLAQQKYLFCSVNTLYVPKFTERTLEWLENVKDKKYIQTYSIFHFSSWCMDDV